MSLEDDQAAAAQAAEAEVARQALSDEDIQRAIDEAQAQIEENERQRLAEEERVREQIAASNPPVEPVGQPAPELPDSIDAPGEPMDAPAPPEQETEPPGYLPGYLPPVVTYPDAPK